MKAFVLMLLLAAGVFAWVRQHPDTISIRAKPEAPVVIEGIIDLADTQGRALRCEITGRIGRHLLVRREADNRSFILKLDTLDAPSRQRFARVADFNTAALEETAFDLAKTTLKVELLSVPALCTFRCPVNGQMLNTADGNELQAYRDFLKQEGIGFRNVALDIKPSPERVFTLPPEMPGHPCMRVGDTYLARQDRGALKTALVANYLAN